MAFHSCTLLIVHWGKRVCSRAPTSYWWSPCQARSFWF